MREIATLSCERDYLLVGDKLNTKMLHVVLECLKDHAFDSAELSKARFRYVSCGMLTKVCRRRPRKVTFREYVMYL